MTSGTIKAAECMTSVTTMTNVISEVSEISVTILTIYCKYRGFSSIILSPNLT